MKTNKNSQRAFRAALTLPGLLLAASCGSTPSGDEATPELTEPAIDVAEVVEEAPEPGATDPELEALDAQLAEMRAALEGMRAALEGQGAGLDTAQAAPAGEPLQDMGSDELAAAELPPGEPDGPLVDDPQAELSDEPIDEQQAAEELAALAFDPSQAPPVEMVDGISFGAWGEPQPTGLDAEPASVEEPAMAATELEVVEPMPEPSEALADAPAVPAEVTGELVAELRIDDPVTPVEEAAPGQPSEVDLTVAAAPEGEASPTPEAVEGTEPIESMETVASIEALPESAQDATELAAATEEPEAAEGTIALEFAQGPVADPDVDPASLFATEQPAAVDEQGAVTEEQSAEPESEPEPELVEQPLEDVEQPAEALDMDPTTDSAVVEALESGPAVPTIEEPFYDPASLVWIDPVPQAVVLDVQEVELGGLHAGLFDPLAPAVQPVVLPASLAFLTELPALERALVAPLLLLDPSGFSARMTTAGPELVLATWTGINPPEVVDPALAGLPGERRVDGSEFGPTRLEDQLSDEPGLGLIWWGTEVPFVHVDSGLDVQTPSVGRVRVVLESGDYVEGLLHSVGGGSYWVDGDLGRFAVKASLVSHVERLPKPGLGAEVSGMQAGDLVRVRTNNGFVEGRLVSMKGEDVLIETAEGMRVTLPGDHVEPLGNSATRVVLP